MTLLRPLRDLNGQPIVSSPHHSGGIWQYLDGEEGAVNNHTKLRERMGYPQNFLSLDCVMMWVQDGVGSLSNLWRGGDVACLGTNYVTFFSTFWNPLRNFLKDLPQGTHELSELLYVLDGHCCLELSWFTLLVKFSDPDLRRPERLRWSSVLPILRGSGTTLGWGMPRT